MGYRLRPEGTDDGNPLDWCQKPSLFFFFFFNVRPARATIITSRYPLGCSFVRAKVRFVKGACFYNQNINRAASSCSCSCSCSSCADFSFCPSIRCILLLLFCLVEGIARLSLWLEDTISASHLRLVSPKLYWATANVPVGDLYAHMKFKWDLVQGISGK
jgi:hypothetical protein